MIDKRLYVFGCSILLVLAGCQSSQPATQLPLPPRLDVVDVNKDSRVNRKEYDQMIANQFDRRDADRDGVLSPDELPLIDNDDFASADRDRDSRVSRREFIQFRFADFDRFDRDGNGYLDGEEYRRWRTRR